MSEGHQPAARHTNVAITLDIHSHVLPAGDETVAHTLANVIVGTP